MVNLCEEKKTYPCRQPCEHFSFIHFVLFCIFVWLLIIFLSLQKTSSENTVCEHVLTWADFSFSVFYGLHFIFCFQAETYHRPLYIPHLYIYGISVYVMI